MVNNIFQFTKHNLCTSCGTCVSICPYDAIEMSIDIEKGIYLPKIDLYRCNNCGKCIQTCPGLEVDYDGLNKNIFNKEPEDPLIGNYIKLYTGYSKNPEIRFNSSSGGLITQILVFALKNKIIDGALVTRMKKDKPLEPESFIARSEKEIIEASGSKYCPVPANIALKEIINSNDEKFAVVGLPCQINGIRKAEFINKKLRNKIILHIGIFCNHSPNLSATEYFLYSKKLNKNDIYKIKYRSGGWKTKMEIILKNQRKLLEEYWGDGFGQFFYPIRCTLCCDVFALLSDISLGDAWLPEIEKVDKKGTSIIISRNLTVEKLLNKALSEDKLVLNELSEENLLKSQHDKVYFKNVTVNARMNILRFFKKKVPDYKITGSSYEITNKDYLNSLLLYIILNISSKKYMWPIMVNSIKLFKKIKNID